ncbi:MAG: hypothetical protein ACYC48_02040 [Minisyncoccota bacterium]
MLLFPAGLAFLAWFPTTSLWVGAFETIGAPVVLTALLSQLGRDLGKKKEPRLFEMWGGMPTDKILAITSTAVDGATLMRYREKLSSLLPSVLFLDEKSESTDPEVAVGIFRTCTNFMREHTRDSVRFPLIFAENVNYGFRRNLWAMKSAGITISLLAALASIATIFFAARASYPIIIVATVLNVSLLVLWIFRITPSWVRVPAEEYARQLFAACEVL